MESDLDRALAKNAENMAQLMLDNTQLRAANSALAETLTWAGECLDQAKYDTCADICRKAAVRYGGK